MHCFKHHSTAAVGLCKSCCKAVCAECAVDVAPGLACAGDCESRVRELNEICDRSARLYGLGRHRTRIPSSGVLMWLLLTIVMWGTAGYAYVGGGFFDVSTVLTALLFTCGLGLAYYGARRTGLKC